MKFDFPIDKVEYSFECVGNCQVNVTLNGLHVVENVIRSDLLKEHNILKISFSKSSPGDTNSYALLRQFKVNGGNFLDDVKILNYKIDKSKHHDAPDEIRNNLYFGYVGQMEVVIEQNTDLLQRAAWFIANDTFDEVKWPTRNANYRTKEFSSVYDDYRFMFTGCCPPKMEELEDMVNDLQIGPLIAPLNKKADKSRLENWINQSNRVTIKNLSHLDYYTVSNGTTDSLFSFLMRNKEIHMPEKMYHHNRQILQGKECRVIDIKLGHIKHNSAVLIELPSPWYSDEHLQSIIDEAKSKNCYIALDLSWLPACMHKIEIDALEVDEIFFSMNKCWPIHSLRPAVRWSKKRINDSQTFDTEVSIYPKIPVNVLYRLIDKFSFDYSFEKYLNDHRDICEKFNLKPTSVLWFTTHDSVQHDSEIMEPHFYLDDFVCIVKLLSYKNKFFW